MKENIYGTETLSEYVVINHPLHCHEWKKIVTPKNSRVLIFNELPLVYEYSDIELNNKVFYVSTTKANIECVKKWFPEVSTAYINGNNIKNLDKYLENRIPKESMDHIIANPPYDRDLFLDISEILLQYLDENGTLNVLSPTICIDNPFYTQYIQEHRELFTHCTVVNRVSSEMTSTFESFNGYSSLGIYSFAATPQQFINPYALWRKVYTPEEIQIFDKVRRAIKNGLPSIKSKMVKYNGHGVLVPLSSIGGETKKSAVMKSEIYVKSNIVLRKTNGEYDETKIKKEEMYEYRGVIFKSTDEAVSWWKKYDTNSILRGIFTMSLGGSQHPHYNIVPYFTNETTEEMIEILGLDKQDIKVLATLSKHGPTKYNK